MSLLSLDPIEYVGRAPRKARRKKKPSFFGGWFLLLLVLGIGFFFVRPMVPFLQAQTSQPTVSNAKKAIEVLNGSEEFSKKLAAAALARIKEEVQYDPGYYDIAYPGGDVPPHKGICADLVVRSYRALGIDLQRLVHEDMESHFSLYPQIWRMKGPDSNIDHRRVPNLQRYFSRFGKELKITRSVDDYQFGDVVAWKLPFGEDKQAGSHIGIVVPGPGAKSGEKWVVHNIGSGPEWEDELFGYEIVGHYRYVPRGATMTASAESETGETVTTAPN